MKLHMRIAIFTIILIAMLEVSLLSYTITASAPEQVPRSYAPPKPDHENDHPYFEYVGTVTKLVPIVIINSPPRGYAEGKASFTAVFSYSIRNNFIDFQKVSSNTLIFNVRAKDGGVAGAFAKVRLEYLHGLLKVTYGNLVEKDITYIFPPGCVWRVHPLGDSVTSA